MSVDLRPTDAELLHEFILRRDQSAFRELVGRHSGLVMATCRQILKHREDAEDAFQATFLLLALKARSIQKRSCLASWLYRVAFRTSIRAAKRRKPSAPLAGDEPASDSESQLLESIYRSSMQQVVYEELNALPESYRLPIVLCYLQQKTRAEAAAELETTEPAVKARLARGKRMLRLRMARRGVALSLALTAVIEQHAEAADFVTPALEELTANRAITPDRPQEWNLDPTSDLVYLVEKGSQAMMLTTATKSLTTTAAVGLMIMSLAVVVNGGDGDSGWSTGEVASNQGGASVTNVNVDTTAAALSDSSEGTANSGPARVRVSTTSSDRQPPATGSRVAGSTATVPIPAPATSASRVPSGYNRFVEVQAQLHNRGLEFEAMKLEVEAEFLERQAKSFQTMARALLRKANETSGWESDAAKGEGMLKEAESRRAKRLAELTRKESERLKKEATRVRAAPTPWQQPRANVYPPTPINPPSAGTLPVPPSSPEALQQSPNAPPAVRVTPPSSAPRYGSSVGPPTVPPQPATYRLQPSDVLKITVENDTRFGEVTIEPEGTVPLGPRYGRLKIAGMTIPEAEEALREHLKKTGEFREIYCQIVPLKRHVATPSPYRRSR